MQAIGRERVERVARIYTTAGTYAFCGRAVHELEEKELTELHRDQIGVVFQAYHLTDEMTVYENLEMPLLYLARDSTFPFPRGHPTARVQLVALLALAVLLLAAVNATNLVTATAGGRLHQVGVRQTMGAGRVQLAAQFLGESVLLAVAVADGG